MQDCNFLDVPLSQSDHKQLRELPNLQRIVALNRGGELKLSDAILLCLRWRGSISRRRQVRRWHSAPKLVEENSVHSAILSPTGLPRLAHWP